jgi:FMN phosphatase YigB (HAD superfamily)
MNWMDQVKVTIFDMDGTLYQDDAFLGRYVTYLLDGLVDEEEVAKAVSEAYDILDGSHTVQLGHFFDREHHFFYEHDQFLPTTCYSWDGKKHENPLKENSTPLFIGDPWCIASLYAEKYRIPRDRRAEAFDKVRYEMIQKPFEIRRHTPLFESIAALGTKKKIFMTNTPGDTGPAFVTYLNIGSLFDDYVFDAKKPYGMETIVKGLLKEGFAPEEILSIGDNPYNDLAPVRKLGGRTCLISPYTHFGMQQWDHTVKTVEELADFLRQPSVVRL